MKLHVPRSPWIRIGAIAAVAAIVGVLLWWRGPDWERDPGRLPGRPVGMGRRRRRAQSALDRRAQLRVADRDQPGDAAASPALPARVLGLLRGPARERGAAGTDRRARAGRGAHAQVAAAEREVGDLVGTVFAHRVFDIVPALLLIGYVLATADIPGWALTSLIAVVSVGSILFLLAFVSARRHHRSVLEEAGTLKRIVTMAQYGLGVMHEPLPAIGAIFFQCLGWLCQFFAVYTAMLGFDIHVPLPAAGLVLVLMNLATIFPLWPGNVGLTQAAIALPLVRHGVPYAKGFAFGIGLQLIEASVGVGVGLFFLGREGLSFAMLRRMPEMTEAELPEPENGSRANARVTVLASPASLKGVLGAVEAAEALVEGFAAARIKREPLPIADGGGGTAAVLRAPSAGRGTRRPSPIPSGVRSRRAG